MSRIRLLDCSKLALNQKNDNDVLICWHNVIVNFFDVLFLLSGWVIGPGFMSISSLLLELWQFFFKGLTRNLEIWNRVAFNSLFQVLHQFYFSIFSIVLPYLALVINLCNAFSSLSPFFSAFMLFCVLNLRYGCSLCDWLNSQRKF